jgi:hypothetical protein
MPYDVSVSSLVPPRFPDRCVLCGADEPGRQVRFSAGAKYGAFFFVAWFGKGKGSILAPACGSCAVSAMSFSLARFALSAAVAAAAAWYLFAGMKGGGRGLFKLKAVAVFFAAVIPAVVWDWLFPARFSVTFDGENHQAICHFSNAGHAAQFEALNHFDTLSAPELPEGWQPGDNPQPLESPANFGPSSFAAAESYEDKTNPYRNLEDPRFKK